jgi:hypothetical protein
MRITARPRGRTLLAVLLALVALLAAACVDPAAVTVYTP